eukprot:8548344-Pyramimonas_sp.AAC.1
MYSAYGEGILCLREDSADVAVCNGLVSISDVDMNGARAELMITLTAEATPTLRLQAGLIRVIKVQSISVKCLILDGDVGGRVGSGMEG